MSALAGLLVLKGGAAFLCASRDGDVRPGDGSGPERGEGLYVHDTRHLSELRVLVDGAEVAARSHAVESAHAAVAEGEAAPTVVVRRTLVVAAGALHVELELRCAAPAGARVDVALVLGADFADVFDVRGVVRRAERGRLHGPRLGGAAAVVLPYDGVDGLARETAVELDPAPTAIEPLAPGRARAAWDVELAPGATWRASARVVPGDGERPRPPRRSLPEARAVADADARRWASGCARVRSDGELVERAFAASARDLHALVTPLAGGRLPAAGIPWYVAPFGRDALLTCHESLLLDPSLARDTLLALAALQAREDDAWRDAEPGKILHELREGELARAGLVPHSPYYGTVDATPLFALLAAEHWRWTGDLETVQALLPALDAALAWIDRHGDLDGDGFLEYRRRSPGGLPNQGWKDSDDSIVHADGTLAEGPIALVEAQAYAYAAKAGVADLLDALGERDRAGALRAQAAALADAFDAAFWNEDEGTYALALDGRKRQVGSVTSNAGHALWCGIAPPRRAAAVAERLLADDLWSGWGVRTLSARSPAYDPASYHNGSVWPHDNAIVAAGLRRYGFADAAERIATAVLEVAGHVPDLRLPELWCGFDRVAGSGPVPYPVACSPQAWAAAAPVALLEASLGIEPDARAGALRAADPRLPAGARRVELAGVRVGAARAELVVERAGPGQAATVRAPA